MGDNCGVREIPLPEKYKENFEISSDISLMKDLPDERPSLETSKFCLYISGMVVSLSHRSWLLSLLTTQAPTV
jgi:hypothetical protein